LLSIGVAQEALTNIARHADDVIVTHSLIECDKAVELRVADDGGGLQGRDEGAGIRGIRERAPLFNGQLTVRSPSAGGTHVSLAVPLTAAGTTTGELRPC
jgi:two-component system sensor histidine kinase UhpB